MARHHRGARRVINHTKTFNAVFLLLLVLTVAGIGWKAYAWSAETLKLAKAGRIACETRFHPQYLERCNVQADGVACGWANRSKLSDWYGQLDYACAQAGPDAVFIVPFSDMPPPSVKPEGIGA